MSGYNYSSLEPKERCPYCGALCCADFVDIGVGYEQCGPYHCESCGASEIGPYDIPIGEYESRLSKKELETGWYESGSPPGPLTNVDDDGRVVTHYEADTLYRKKCGVEPRYDKYGQSIKGNY